MSKFKKGESGNPRGRPSALQKRVDAATALAALKCTIWGDVSLVSRPELEELLATDSTEIRR